MTNVAFAFDALTVFEFCPQTHVDVGGWHHLALHG
jgi:hypothetical protein